MTLHDDVQRKLQGLLDEAPGVIATQRETPVGRFLDEGMSRRFASKAKLLLHSIFGPQSPITADAVRFSDAPREREDFDNLWGVVAAAIDSWRDGFVFNVRAEAEAEVEGSLLGSAQELATRRGVNEPERRAAAVLAGSVLERHLRTVLSNHGGTNAEQLTIEPLGTELKKLGVIDEVQRKRLSAIGASRNSAAHDTTFSNTADEVKRDIDAVTDICARLR